MGNMHMKPDHMMRYIDDDTVSQSGFRHSDDRKVFELGIRQKVFYPGPHR